jgi:hypothetical protein
MPIKLLYISLLIFALFSKMLASENPLDPTGTYNMPEDTIIDGEYYGRFGEIQVNLLSESKIFISFSVSRGFPSYNMGNFEDTLSYNNNTAIYTLKDEPDCEITFVFTNKDVNVFEKSIGSCEFGGGVIAGGIYYKTSATNPELKK